MSNKEIQTYLTKHWGKILEDYELVKRQRHPYFKTCKELYDFYHTSAKQVSKYYKKYLSSGGSESSLLPERRGPKLGTNRTHKGIERDIIKAYRRLGLNRYELVDLFTPVYKEKTPAASTMYLIVKRYQRGLRQQEKEAIKRYERKYPGELGHIDCYYLPQSTIKPLSLVRGFLCALSDDCTRIAYTEIIRNNRSADVAGFLGRALAFFYRNYGIRFERLMSDNGSEFRGTEFKFLINYLKIKQIFIKPYHPQTNGKIEAFWKIIHREFLSPNRFTGLKDFIGNLGEYLYRFNHERRHGGLGYITPWQKYVSVSKIVTELLD